VNEPQEPEAGEKRIGEERQRDAEGDEVLRDIGGHREDGIRQPWNRPDRGQAAEEVEDGVAKPVRSEARKARADPKRQQGAPDDQQRYEAVRTHRLALVTQVNTTSFLGPREEGLEHAPAPDGLARSVP